MLAAMSPRFLLPLMAVTALGEVSGCGSAELVSRDPVSDAGPDGVDVGLEVDAGLDAASDGGADVDGGASRDGGSSVIDARAESRCTPAPGVEILETVRPGDERLRQRLLLANGVYAIELAPHPEWRTGPTYLESSYFRFEGQNPAILDRVIAISRCPGDTTADDDTVAGTDREFAAFGGYVYFHALPSDAPLVSPTPVLGGPRGIIGLPGLGEATTWYINILQTRCENEPGMPAEACGLTYDVIP